MNRRQFLKGIAALGAAFPGLSNIELDLDDLELADEQIKAISNVESIEMVEYSPYFHVSSRGEEASLLYRVSFRDGQSSSDYFDIRGLCDEFGEAVEYLVRKFELPEVYEAGYDYYNRGTVHPHYQPPWWNS